MIVIREFFCCFNLHFAFSEATILILSLLSSLYLFQMLKHKISLLEASNGELQRELQERRISCEHLTKRAIDAQVWIIVISSSQLFQGMNFYIVRESIM